MMVVLANAMAVIILQDVNVSNQHFVSRKLTQYCIPIRSQ